MVVRIWADDCKAPPRPSSSCQIERTRAAETSKTADPPNGEELLSTTRTFGPGSFLVGGTPDWVYSGGHWLLHAAITSNNTTDNPSDNDDAIMVMTVFG